MENYENPRIHLKSRTRVISLILAFAAVVVVVRLAYIQIFNSDRYKKSATDAQWTDEIIPAERGTIFDANGTVIARSAVPYRFGKNP